MIASAQLAKNSRGELWRALTRERGVLVAIGTTSTVLNLLVLSGSIYMMMVYDSVLPSHNLATLAGLFAMMIGAYLFQAWFETLRARLMGGIATSFDREIGPRVMRAVVTARTGGMPVEAAQAQLRDYDQLRGFLAGPGPAAMIDLPWVPLFLVVLFLLHPWLAGAATLGAIALVGITWINDRQSRAAIASTGSLTGQRHAAASTCLQHNETLRVLGMSRAMQARWEAADADHRTVSAQLAQMTAFHGSSARTFRLFLQSAILTVGAVLVIAGQASGGIIFAASVLSSRMLAPVDQVIGAWRGFTAARIGWRRLEALLAALPAPVRAPTALPAPKRQLTVEGLVSGPPAAQRVTVNGVGFRLEAGEALGVIGPSAAGKSSLIRAIAGAWPAMRGAVRLDGAALDQWDPDQLGRHLGYLPQTVELLQGSIAQNIGRFSADASDASVIDAARAAGAHEMIVRLPQGYDTRITAGAPELSAGQRQRIALARALFGDPFLVLLDEPNANLDGEGETALAAAIAGVRARGGIVIVATHRPGILAEVDRLLVLREGSIHAIGTRDEILPQVTPRPLQAAA